MPSRISSNQIQILKTHLSDGTTVLNPEDPGYESSLKRWSDTAVKPAGVVVFPGSPEDVGKAVKFAHDNGIDLAVKGGGHSTDLSASSDGGIVIDLGRLKKVTVDPTDKTVTVQGGALWADVDKAAAQFDLAVVGGTVSHTGVGGLTLRGGYGFLTPEYGLAIDNLIAAKVVTADGQQLTATDEVNTDLFWAIKGAGQCIGVVVEFMFKAHPQPHYVWTGMITFAADKLPAIIDSLNGALRHPEGKASAQCVLARSPDGAVVTTVVFFNGSEEAGKRHFSRLLEIEAIDYGMKARAYEETNTMLDPVLPVGGRKSIVGLLLAPPIRPEFASRVMNELQHKITAEPDMSSTCIEIDYFDMSKICQTPATETAFPSRRMILNAALLLQWSDPNKDAELMDWAENIQDMCNSELRDAGYEPGRLVSNFFSYSQDCKLIPADMFGDNSEHLMEVKKKYDPGNFFRKLNPLTSELN
ncbi:hypothetical protein BDV25DRAFT_134576 [Aspergillus avenaceus]|uniref:FAD-binding PCMH-type domain-containing protein n=1 Tax=Aspergillus avenaceus TaxID=36643 RepID=A0A5N6TE68_ASPAV|nr:hypothetical protein BDV25DRAFT_134576 [Aspergillus avenaceus]